MRCPVVDHRPVQSTKHFCLSEYGSEDYAGQMVTPGEFVYAVSSCLIRSVCSYLFLSRVVVWSRKRWVLLCDLFRESGARAHPRFAGRAWREGARGGRGRNMVVPQRVTPGECPDQNTKFMSAGVFFGCAKGVVRSVSPITWCPHPTRSSFSWPAVDAYFSPLFEGRNGARGSSVVCRYVQ